MGSLALRRLQRVGALTAFPSAHDLTFTNNKLYGAWASGFMFWTDAEKDPQPLECNKGTVLDLRDGAYGVTIDHNWFSGGFDQISTNNCEHDIDIHHNRMDRAGDDAFEIEAVLSTHCSSPSIGDTQIYENYIENPLVAFAIGQDSATMTGDVLVYRNIVFVGRDPAVNRKGKSLTSEGACVEEPSPGSNAIVCWNDGFRFGTQYLHKTHNFGSAPSDTPRIYYYHNTELVQNTKFSDGINLVPGEIKGSTADTKAFANILWHVNQEVDGSQNWSTIGTDPLGSSTLADDQLAQDYNLYFHPNPNFQYTPAHLLDTYGSRREACDSVEKIECNGLVGLGLTPVGDDPLFAGFSPLATDYDRTDEHRWVLLPDWHAQNPGAFLLSGMSPACGASRSAGFSNSKSPMPGTLPDSRDDGNDIGALPCGATDVWTGNFPWNMKWGGCVIPSSNPDPPPSPPECEDPLQPESCGGGPPPVNDDDVPGLRTLQRR